jgi:hypothetical protein
MDGAVLEFNPMAHLSLTGHEGSGFVFMEGSYINVAGTEYGMPVSEDLTVGIEGKLSYDIAYSFGQQGISATITGEAASKTAISVNGGTIFFRNGASAELEAVMDLKDITFSELVTDILQGEVPDFGAILDIEMEYEADTVELAYEDYQVTITGDEGKAEIKGQLAGKDGQILAAISIETEESGTGYTDDFSMEVKSKIGMHIDLGDILPLIMGDWSEFDPHFEGDMIQNVKLKDAGSGSEAVVDTAASVYDNVIDVRVFFDIETLEIDEPGLEICFDDVRISHYSELDIGDIWDVLPIINFRPIAYGELLDEALAVEPVILTDDPEELSEDIGQWIIDILDDISYEGKTEFSIGGMRYTHADSTQIAQYYVYGCKGEIDISLDDGEYNILGDLSADEMQMANGDLSGLTSMDFYDLNVGIRSEGGTATVMGSCDMNQSIYYNGQLYSYSDNVDMAFSLEVDLESQSIGMEYTSEMTTFTQGVTMEYGVVQYSTSTGLLTAETVNISGMPWYSGNLEYVEGQITNLSQGYALLFPMMETDFDSAVITYYCEKGKTLKVEIEDYGLYTDLNFTVSNDFDHDIVGDYNLPFTSMLLQELENSTVLNINVAGEGKLFMNDLDLTDSVLNGTIYVKNSLTTDDLVLFLNFWGVSLAVEGDTDHMKIYPLEGFIHDESTYEGFTVDDSGYVILDESIIAEGGGMISARGNSFLYPVVVDGVEYMMPVDEYQYIELGESIVFVVDDDGKVYGQMENGVWKFILERAGGIILHTVEGSTVEGKDGEIVKVNDDTFSVTLPEEYDYVMVENKDGLIFQFVDYYGDSVNVSAKKITYDGKPAFDITSNAKMYVFVPVKDTNMYVSHIVKGAEVDMVVLFTQFDGQLYAFITCNSYSVYVFDGKLDLAGDNYVHWFSLAIIAVLVLLFLGYLHVKAHKK